MPESKAWKVLNASEVPDQPSLDNGDKLMNAAPSRSLKLDEGESSPSEFEGEIREFIRRDVAHLRRPLTESSERVP